MSTPKHKLKPHHIVQRLNIARHRHRRFCDFGATMSRLIYLLKAVIINTIQYDTNVYSRGVYPYLPMAQLSQFWGVLFKKWKFSFEDNLRLKQHNFHRRCTMILNVNFVRGPYGEDCGTIPWPSLRTSSGWGNCAYVARG